MKMLSRIVRVLELFSGVLLMVLAIRFLLIEINNSPYGSSAIIFICSIVIVFSLALLDKYFFVLLTDVITYYKESKNGKEI